MNMADLKAKNAHSLLVSNIRLNTTEWFKEHPDALHATYPPGVHIQDIIPELEEEIDSHLRNGKTSDEAFSAMINKPRVLASMWAHANKIVAAQGKTLRSQRVNGFVDFGECFWLKLERDYIDPEHIQDFDYVKILTYFFEDLQRVGYSVIAVTPDTPQ